MNATFFSVTVVASGYTQPALCWPDACPGALPRLAF